MDAHLFSQWKDKIIELLEAKKVLNPIRRHLIVLDGCNSLVILHVIEKAKEHGVDLHTTSNHISHELQPLDVACFRSFKQAFRAHRNVWSMTNPKGKCKKEDFASWLFLSLKKVLTSSKIRVGFNECGIWSLNPQAMRNKMGPSNIFKVMDVEVEECVEEILKNGSLPTLENSSSHYNVQHKDGDEDPEVLAIAENTPHYSNFL